MVCAPLVRIVRAVHRTAVCATPVVTGFVWCHRKHARTAASIVALVAPVVMGPAMPTPESAVTAALRTVARVTPAATGCAKRQWKTALSVHKIAEHVRAVVMAHVPTRKAAKPAQPIVVVVKLAVMVPAREPKPVRPARWTVVLVILAVMACVVALKTVALVRVTVVFAIDVEMACVPTRKIASPAPLTVACATRVATACALALRTVHLVLRTVAFVRPVATAFVVLGKVAHPARLTVVSANNVATGCALRRKVARLAQVIVARVKPVATDSVGPKMVKTVSHVLPTVIRAQSVEMACARLASKTAQRAHKIVAGAWDAATVSVRATKTVRAVARTAACAPSAAMVCVRQVSLKIAPTAAPIAAPAQV